MIGFVLFFERAKKELHLKNSTFVAFGATRRAGVRAEVTFGTATTADPSVINNTASPSVFTMTSNAQTIAGAFLASVSSGTSGVLFSAGDFSGGDKLVDSGDSLSVTYVFSLDAA